MPLFMPRNPAGLHKSPEQPGKNDSVGYSQRVNFTHSEQSAARHSALIAT